jgi:hypothetical protein
MSTALHDSYDIENKCFFNEMLRCKNRRSACPVTAPLLICCAMATVSLEPHGFRSQSFFPLGKGSKQEFG